MSSPSHRVPATQDWTKVNADLGEALKVFRKAAPEVAQAFGGLVRAAGRPGTPEYVEQELIAMALAVSTRCEGCIAIHAKALAEAGIERDRLVRALEMAVVFGGGPSFTTGALALEAFDQNVQAIAEQGKSHARPAA